MCWERKLGEHGVNEPKIPCKFNWLARGKAPHFARLLEFFFKVVGENKAEETSSNSSHSNLCIWELAALQLSRHNFLLLIMRYFLHRLRSGCKGVVGKENLASGAKHCENEPKVPWEVQSMAERKGTALTPNSRMLSSSLGGKYNPSKEKGKSQSVSRYPPDPSLPTRSTHT